ncbi:MAG TPA: nuclear transport factor 2 family protein [Solirubrobacterales bacterium]|nr:nuclear transport factor 2 family protein [Solirubrobacterales bacterium]
MRRAGICLGVVAVLLAAGYAGCGSDDNGGDSGGDQPLTARQTARAYVAGQNAGDFARVCALFGDPLRQQLGGDNCVEFLKEQTSGAPRHTYRLTAVGASGNEGTAYILTRGETGKPVKLSLFLARRDGEWKIIGSGPTAPRGVPVPD